MFQISAVPFLYQLKVLSSFKRNSVHWQMKLMFLSNLQACQAFIFRNFSSHLTFQFSICSKFIILQILYRLTEASKYLSTSNLFMRLQYKIITQSFSLHSFLYKLTQRKRKGNFFSRHLSKVVLAKQLRNVHRLMLSPSNNLSSTSPAICESRRE